MSLPRIAITPGEPAGVGPDILLHLVQRAWPAELVAIADPALLEQRARLLGLDLHLRDFDPAAPPDRSARGSLSILPIELAATVTPGELAVANAPYVLATLDAAVRGCLAGQLDALVTGPVQKSIINAAGIPFSGHTEYLAAATDTDQVVMMLAAGDLRVALATTHLPLAAVPAAITPALLESTLRILDRDLKEKFALPSPAIAVLGLNPHAGEGGYLGREELDVIVPTLEALRRDGLRLEGPLPADTAFNPDILERTDAYFAMYHDQGLPVLKYAGFGSAINITLGLPIIRTSVDHGTALDLAGTGRASSGSLAAALEVALHCCGRS